MPDLSQENIAATARTLRVLVERSSFITDDVDDQDVMFAESFIKSLRTLDGGRNNYDDLINALVGFIAVYSHSREYASYSDYLELRRLAASTPEKDDLPWE